MSKSVEVKSIVSFFQIAHEDLADVKNKVRLNLENHQIQIIDEQRATMLLASSVEDVRAVLDSDTSIPGVIKIDPFLTGFRI